MKNNNKKKVITFFISICSTLIIFTIWLYINDPLQIFHKQDENKGLVSNARHQVLGLIDNYNFDSIIMGTSILENSSSKESSKILGGKFINLSIEGSDFHTRSIILEYILKRRKLNKIIFSLDNYGLVEAQVSDTSNFDFLYDNNKINDIKVYISPKYLICSIYKSYCLNNLDIDRPFSWYQNENRRFGGFENWLKSKNNNKIKAIFKEIIKITEKIERGEKNIEKEYQKNLINSQQYIDKNLIKYVSKYPNTEFISILPPYSRIKYAIEAQYHVSKFKRYKENIRYLVRQSQKYPNLKIYGWGNHEFIDKIENYQDLIHYHYKINSWMLKAIKRDEGLLTPTNIESYLTTFTQKSLNYDLFKIRDKINRER